MFLSTSSITNYILFSFLFMSSREKFVFYSILLYFKIEYNLLVLKLFIIIINQHLKWTLS
jgi:hypothetical protein